MPDMTPEDIEKYMNEIHSLPHIEYHKNDPEIYFPKKEETDEEPEGDSSGHPRADDA
jgi:hypothetical protein|tara:strand:- start:754 stop:924 length:171 start_codon:yes stop_codon:yes gene_type:complete